MTTENHDHTWIVTLKRGQVQERCECGQAQWAQFKDNSPPVMALILDLHDLQGVYFRLMTADEQARYSMLLGRET